MSNGICRHCIFWNPGKCYICSICLKTTASDLGTMVVYDWYSRQMLFNQIDTAAAAAVSASQTAAVGHHPALLANHCHGHHPTDMLQVYGCLLEQAVTGWELYSLLAHCHLSVRTPLPALFISGSLCFWILWRPSFPLRTFTTTQKAKTLCLNHNLTPAPQSDPKPNPKP